MKFKKVVKDIWKRYIQIVDMKAAVVAQKILVRADGKLAKLSRDFVNVRWEPKSKQEEMVEEDIIENPFEQYL